MACGTRSTPSSRASSSLERTSVEEAVSLELTPDEAARITREQREMKANKSKNLLEVRNLSTHFFTADGVVHAVVDVIFERRRIPYAGGLLDSLPRHDDVRVYRLRPID